MEVLLLRHHQPFVQVTRGMCPPPHITPQRHPPAAVHSSRSRVMPWASPNVVPPRGSQNGDWPLKPSPLCSQSPRFPESIMLSFFSHRSVCDCGEQRGMCGDAVAANTDVPSSIFLKLCWTQRRQLSAALHWAQATSLL